jgi:hypothetical protein
MRSFRRICTAHVDITNCNKPSRLKLSRIRGPRGRQTPRLTRGLWELQLGMSQTSRLSSSDHLQRQEKRPTGCERLLVPKRLAGTTDRTMADGKRFKDSPGKEPWGLRWRSSVWFVTSGELSLCSPWNWRLKGSYDIRRAAVMLGVFFRQWALMRSKLIRNWQ